MLWLAVVSSAAVSQIPQFRGNFEVDELEFYEENKMFKS